MCYHFADDDTEEYIEWYCNQHGIKKYYWRGNYYVNGYDHKKNVVHAQGATELQEMEWGLIPFWFKPKTDVKEIQDQTLNATCEFVFERASYKHLIKKRKCLIFIKYFYEWRHITPKNKIPYLIGVRNEEMPHEFKPFTLGGICDTWTDTKTGEIKDTFSVITTPANSMMEIIHNSKKRMPLIIGAENHNEWLNATEPEAIKKLMVPFPSERMKAHPISKNISQRGTEKNIPETLLAQEYEEVAMDEFM